MAIQSERELIVTKEKLQRLEDRYRLIEEDHSGDARLREWTLHSLRKIINQLREEITRFQAHASVRNC